MNHLLSPKDQWVEQATNRLRLLQSNCVHEPPDVRLGFLRDEFHAMSQTLQPQLRKEYVQALKERFPLPTFGTSSSETPADDHYAEAGQPKDVFQRFLALAHTLSPDEIKQVVAALPEIESPLAAPSNASRAVACKELQRHLHLPADTAIDLQNLQQLTALLAEFLALLDQLAWNIWKSIAPRSKTAQRQGSSPVLAGKFLTGDPDVPLSQVRDQIHRSRQLIAALLAAINPAAKTMARQQAGSFSPDHIKNLVGQGTMWKAPEVQWWNKYTELAREAMSEEAIERALKDAIANFTESMMRTTITK